MHIHTPEVVAVSAMEEGLLPISQESAILGPIAYHDYRGIFIDDAEKHALASAMLSKEKETNTPCHILMLRNHGVVAAGSSIPEAMHYMFNVHHACSAQVLAMGRNGSGISDEKVRNSHRE